MSSPSPPHPSVPPETLEDTGQVNSFGSTLFFFPDHKRHHRQTLPSAWFWKDPSLAAGSLGRPLMGWGSPRSAWVLARWDMELIEWAHHSQPQPGPRVGWEAIFASWPGRALLHLSLLGGKPLGTGGLVHGRTSQPSPFLLRATLADALLSTREARIRLTNSQSWR